MDDDLRITATISETSGGPISGSEIQYYLSTNTTISSSDYLLGNDDVNLSANSSGDEYILFKPQNINGLTTGTYYIGIKSVDQLQTWASTYTIDIHDVGTSIKEILDFSLSQNYPNPFNPSTTISYDLPEYSNVSLKILDLNSKEVFSMEDELDAGHYELNFDPISLGLSTGIYIYTLKAGDFIETKKMVYMK